MRAFICLVLLVSCAFGQAKGTKQKAGVAAPPVPPTADDLERLRKSLSEVAATSKPATPLSETAKAATELSSSWIGATNIPEPGRDGRVMYVFGAGLPTVVCAPLRVCVIELQPGEHVIGEPALGDQIRWDLSPHTVGREPGTITLVVIKPLQAGLDTNLVLATDRRAYYLRLVSDEKRYTARVGFTYPDERSAVWLAETNRRQAELRHEEAERRSAVTPGVEPALNYRYDFKVTKGKDKSIEPVRVGDDGTRTYIVMSPAAEKRDMPILQIQPKSGKPEMVNYRITDGNTLVVDRLFEHALLLSGTGKAQLRAEIFRREGKTP